MSPQLRDGLNFFYCLTPRRVWNAFLVTLSFYLGKLFNRPFHWGMPIAISIEPTTACNLRCPECPSGLRSFTRPRGTLNPESFGKIIDELSPTLSYLIFYFQGEPFLHKQIFELIRKAADKKIYTATSTNAHFLDKENARKTVESGLHRCIISIDGTTQEVYEQYRIDGNLDKVLQGAKNLVEAKRELNSTTPQIIFQFLVVKPNEHQIEEVHRLAKEIGVDEVRLKTAQIYEYEQGSPLIPTIEKYARYQKQADGSWKIKNKLINHCWKLWHSCVITWDGIVVPCCFDKDAEYRMGNAFETSFNEVWNSDAYQSFRATVVRSRAEIEMCKNCTEGTKVWG